MKKFASLALVVGIVALIAAACASPAVPTAAPVIQTQVVEKVQTQVVEKVQTTVVQVEKVVTATPAPTAAPNVADSIIIGTWQQPSSFLDYANTQAIRVEEELLYRPRFVMRNNFKFAPNPNFVAGDLPTFENGGAVLKDVSYKMGDTIFNPETFKVEPAAADGTAKQLVVTGKLKPGLKWSDGEPLTAKDFIYAWKKNCEADSGAIDVTYCLGDVAGSAGVVQSYQAPDDTTLVLTFVPNALDALYQILVFGPEGTPQPEHLFKDMKAADILKDERATGGETASPLGYGPYVIKEWKKGDHTTFTANPNWVGTPPKTANIIYRYFTDSTALAAAAIAGEIDSTSAITGLSVDQAPYMESVAKTGAIKYSADPNSASFEMLYLNYDDPTDKTFKKAHPVLGDYAVRKAISMALNRQQMVDTIYYGQSAVVEQPQLPQMKSYNPEWGKITYDVEAAKKLLDDAGWKVGADGIREKNGVKAKLNYLTTSGNPPRTKASQVIQASLKELGIDVATTFQPSSVTFSSDGLYGRNFDMIQFANVFSVVDPGGWLYGVASCDQILTPENDFAGSNFAGWCNKAASDASAHQNYLTLDEKERSKDWETIIKAYFAPPTGDDYRTGGYPVIPLFTRPTYLATAPGLTGAALDGTEYFTWNAGDWTLTTGQ